MTTKCCLGLHLHQVVELVILAVVTLLIWGGLTLPTVFYFIPKPTDTVGQPTMAMNMSIGVNYTTPNPFGPVNCSKGFYTDPLGYCHAECGKWNLFPRTTQLVSDVFSIIALSVGIVAAIVVMVIAVWKKKFFKFPSVLVIYGTLSAAIFDVFVLIGYMNRTKLFCSSRNQLESYFSATPFCSFVGVVTLYAVLQICYWWGLHILTLFFTVKFPTISRSMKKSNRVVIIHIISVAVAILLPLATMIAAFSTSGYTHFSIISAVCIPLNRNVVYYGIVLPYGVMLAIGTPFLISILWIIIKQRTKLQIPGKKRNRPGTPEIKVVILLCYNISLALLYLIALSALSHTFPQYFLEVQAYLECESVGILACDRQSFERFNLRIILLVSTILLWIFPLVNLVYVISVEDIKERYTKYVSHIFRIKAHDGQSHIAMDSIAKTSAHSVHEEAADHVCDMKISSDQ